MLWAFSITVLLITWLPPYFKNLVLNSFKMSKAYALGLLYNSFGVEPPSFVAFWRIFLSPPSFFFFYLPFQSEGYLSNQPKEKLPIFQYLGLLYNRRCSLIKEFLLNKTPSTRFFQKSTPPPPNPHTNKLCFFLKKYFKNLILHLAGPRWTTQDWRASKWCLLKIELNTKT